MKQFRFGLGNTNTEEVGLCFTVEAGSLAEAICQVQESLADWEYTELFDQAGWKEVALYVSLDTTIGRGHCFEVSVDGENWFIVEDELPEGLR
jgi:hypothetical protein